MRAAISLAEAIYLLFRFESSLSVRMFFFLFTCLKFCQIIC